MDFITHHSIIWYLEVNLLTDSVTSRSDLTISQV